jgi:hypothetical protein
LIGLILDSDPGMVIGTGVFFGFLLFLEDNAYLNGALI